MTDGDYQERKRVALELLEKRKVLPIWYARKSLVKLVAKHETLVLVGETGSGKTTQAPQLVQQQLQLPGIVACTQPRRVAAITVAQRVAAEQGVQVGGKVGYSVRFDDNTSEGTRIKYMTDGMLIREAIIDPKLRSYSVVFVDEAHERTVNTDVLLGLLKRAQRHRHPTRHPLKLVIMSATLDQANFLEFFEGSIPAYIEGRQFPVEVFYTREPQESYLQATMNAILQVLFPAQHCTGHT
jgi:ATP-dependent RNA helicase DHX8/PRP22